MESAEENLEVSRINPDNEITVRRVEIEKWVKLGLMYFCTFLLLVFWQKFHIPLETAIFPLVVGDTGILLSSIYNLRSCENFQKRLFFKEIIENTGSILSKILLILYFSMGNFLLSYTIIPVFCSTFANLMIKSVSYTKCQTLSDVVFIIIRVTRLVSFISISLKIDEIYDFNVKLALWPIWSFLGIIGIISLGLLVYTIGNCFNCESRVSRLEKLSSLWLLATCLWALVAFTVFFFSLVDGSPDFTPPLVFLGCFSIVTAAFAKKLQKGLTIFLFETVEYNTPYTLPNEVLPSQASSPSIKKSLIRALKNSPKALIQLSAAYFKPIPESAKEKRRAESQITKKNQVVPINFFEDSPNIFHKRCNSTENQRVRGFSIPGMSPKNFIIEKCLICMENDSNAVYMDCGHGGICYLCALKIQSNSGDCHICRSPIAHVLKVVKTSGGVLEVVNDELTDRESL